MRSVNFFLKTALLYMKRFPLAAFSGKLPLFINILALMTACFLMTGTKEAAAVEISPLLINRDGSFISVQSSLVLDDTLINDLKNGVQKEFIFYIDLFRQWDLWPDEFIYGTKQTRTIKSNPIKKEYTVLFEDGEARNERRFNSLESLLDQALRINEIHVFSTTGLPAGHYFVRVTVESRIRKLAPIIGYLLFFVPEREFTIEKDSPLFEVHQ